ncbi:MAG: RHS repeat-associated core domain-containing protein, partial [Bacteroidales bacterium]|nr:RHS repeat-associated core domain-containing protein [Bacteroidales bacterium]
MNRSRTYSPTLSRRAMFPAPQAQAHVPAGWVQRRGNSHTDYCSLSTIRWTFTFSAKERDSETGLSYFGSRYYSSDLSIWLSVDPQASKYPSLSPYVYCANNPVKLVDPNGEEWYVNQDG